MDLGLTEKLRKQREQTRRGLSGQYDNTDACLSFYNGDQMTYQDTIQFLDTGGRRKRATVNFNKVQSNVDSVVGFMAQNRRQAKFIARLNASAGQQVYSKNMNALYTFHRENANADQIETDQDADMMINGYGATESDLSYIVGNATTDPNGEIIKVRLDPKKVGWDPTARAKNLTDARWAYYFDDYELSDALSLFQGSSKEDFQNVGDDPQDSDEGYIYNPYGGRYDKIKYEDTVEWSSKSEDMVRVYNHQWFEYETFYKAKNPVYLTDSPDTALYFQMRLEAIAAEVELNGPEDLETRDMFTLDPVAEELIFDEKTKRLLVKEFGEFIDPVGFKRKVFHTAVYSGKHVFTEFRSISQQGFSIKFKTGIFNASQKIWVGMVNAMMDPQKYYNKALTELMFTIAANSKGGVMVEEDAVEDVADFEAKWARTDATIVVRSGAISGQKIQEKTRGALPTGLENIITLSAQGISEAGVDPAFLGNMNKEDQSGILYKRRIRQIISKMARYFDSITMYQKEDARLYADLIKVWVENNNGAFVKVIGEDGLDEFMQVSEDMLAPEYDVSIQEAPETPEDKQETAAAIAALGDKYLSAMDVPTAKAFHAEALQLIPGLDGDVRNRLSQILQPSDMVPMAQVQEMQARIQELEGIIQQGEVAKNMSEVEKNRALTQKAHADTAHTLEEAANKGLENDLIRQGNYDQVNVSI